MSAISNLFARHWRVINLAIVIILTAVLVIGPPIVRSLVNEAVLGLFYAPFARVKNTVTELQAVASENDRLRRLLVETSLVISMNEEASRENFRLRSILGFDPPPDYVLMPAEVLSISGDLVPFVAVINRGEIDSVKIDQPVINQHGLIGRISGVTRDFATVQLLTDPSNRVASRLARSREMGIIKFQGSAMILDNFPIQGSIEPGDTVLSSGLGGIYPAGLRVGTVLDVKRPDLEPFCKVHIEPFVNFHSLDELFVLRVERTQ